MITCKIIIIHQNRTEHNNLTHILNRTENWSLNMLKVYTTKVFEGRDLLQLTANESRVELYLWASWFKA